ncbi:MBL fold metallo-hydrolase [Enterovirga sp. DB1703]|uniref:MBL fold metallo-hydrolase n=1 Tax=Enterovirga aerilata TaxID=2730920 RepID=A0A849IDW7_9HYPH|nr:MBL fold metallo-hydrolase [Enterovirga sp. DB1703]
MGDVEVTCLFDGGMTITNDRIQGFFPDGRPDELASLRERAFESPDGLKHPVGCYLLRTSRNVALVDCGGHPAFLPTVGRSLDSLRAAGVRPEEVDTVLLTHIHPEHALGLSYDGQTRNFPNAEIVVTDVDHRYWTDPGMESRVPQGRRFIDFARQAIAPYRDRIRLIAADRSVEAIPGVFTDPAPGHTPGHVSYRFSSAGQEMLIWGDIAHQNYIQLARPRWRVGVDYDPSQGVESRLRTLDMLAGSRALVGGCHTPWPGFGRVVRAGDGYEWVPRPWQI